MHAGTVHGSQNAKSALELALAGGQGEYSSTAPARLELLGNNAELLSILAQVCSALATPHRNELDAVQNGGLLEIGITEQSV